MSLDRFQIRDTKAKSCYTQIVLVTENMYAIHKVNIHLWVAASTHECDEGRRKTTEGWNFDCRKTKISKSRFGQML